MMARLACLLSAWVALVCAYSCAYRLVPGALLPLDEAAQGAGVIVEDDGTVTQHLDRLRVGLRPLTDEELNRQFGAVSALGTESTNPYTYGNWVPEGAASTPRRFAVFLLSVDNYEYPKVLIDPLKVEVRTQNGRIYESLSFEILREHYYPYNVAYAGLDGARFRERVDRLKRTMYPRADPIFAGQSREGFLVFPRLHDDVLSVSIEVSDVVLRFDYRGEATETRDLVYHFERDVQRAE